MRKFWACLVFLLALQHIRAQNTPRAFDQAVRPFLATHCYTCHNATLKTADVNLEDYRTTAAILKDPELWENVVTMLRTRQMPPKGAPAPADAERDRIANWIEAEFEKADRAAKPDAGRVTARRLNRTEYNHTIRDLLGVHFRPADDFPQDDSGYGFDNIGDVLSLSPVLMEKYLSAAEKISRAAVFGPEPIKPAGERFQPPGRRGPPPRSAQDYDETGLSLASALHIPYRFPVDGDYVFRATCDGRRQGTGGADMAFWVDGKLIDVKHIEANDLEGQTREVRTHVEAGERIVSVTFWKVFERLPASFGGKNPVEDPAAAPRRAAFQPPPNATPQQLAEFKARQAARQAQSAPQAGRGGGIQYPAGKVDFLYIGGPFDPKPGASRESLEKVFTCGHLHGGHLPGCDRKIVSSIARRAFRRPVTAREVDRFTSLVALAQKRRDSFEDGIALAIQGILVSPHFLFRMESDSPAAAPGNRHISQYELASRLSYFLWASMPDNELLQAAGQGTLRTPAVLEAQVGRMLKDPKAVSLVKDFSGQWLELRNLDSVKPDRRFVLWDDHLRYSMRRETELFLENLIREDLPVTTMLDANYSFLNDRLAEFYGVPNIKGQEFRRVDLTGTKRGGILTQASILTVSSYATRTSPVLRGKWILENILNTPPPPPPANVPALDDTAIGSAASLRQQLEAHRADAGCAACHVRLDPLGLGLENFDAIGAWRDTDGKFPIDASGTLPDGRTFDGPEQMRGIIASQKAAFTEAITDKMLTYALGRGLERYDRRTVKEIARRVAANRYRFSSLVLEIAKSLPFQMRRSEREIVQ